MTDPAAIPNLPPLGDAPPLLEAPLIERVMAALTELELDPSIDADGDVTFTFQEQQLFIRAANEDAQILRVFGQWRLQEPVPTDRAERLEICNDVNIAFNMIKTAMAEDTLLVTSEHLLPQGADLRSLFGVIIPLVLHSVALWHQRAFGEVPGLPGAPAPGDGPASGDGPGGGAGAAFGLNGAGPGA